MFLTLAIIICSVFIIVYLRLYFFKKQRVEVANFSQRIMTFVMDWAMFNAVALGYMIYSLIPEGFSSFLKQGGLQDLFAGMKITWAEYMDHMRDDGAWYLWSDLRIVETWIIGITFCYTVLLEIIRKSKGSFGRNNSETLVAVNMEGDSLPIWAILVRNVVKFAPLMVATYWMGTRGVFIYLVILYCVYRINKLGRLPHDFLVGSMVMKKNYLHSEK